MNVLRWISDNRLKAMSVFAVCGDFFIGLAGAAGFFNVIKTASLSDTILMSAGIVALIGHAAILLWGKGGRLEHHNEKIKADIARPIMRAFFPLRYPLDFGFVTFAMAGILHATTGVLSQNWALVLMGCVVCGASVVGWLWPENKKIFGFRPTQITAKMYFISTLSQFMASYIADNFFMFLSACCFAICNFILFTVRKENQSNFTQGV